MKNIIIIVFALSFFISSCSTTGNFNTIHDFNIKSGTRVAVRCNQDPLNLVPVIENKLIITGLEVVPYETAIRANVSSSNLSLQNSNDKIEGDINSSSSKVVYISSAVLIDLDYSYQYGMAASSITNMTAKIIDLNSKKMLAIFSYRGSNFTTGVPDALAEDIAKNILKHVVNE